MQVAFAQVAETTRSGRGLLNESLIANQEWVNCIASHALQTQPAKSGIGKGKGEKGFISGRQTIGVILPKNNTQQIKKSQIKGSFGDVSPAAVKRAAGSRGGRALLLLLPPSLCLFAKVDFLFLPLRSACKAL